MITAKWASVCVGCNKPINVGDEIEGLKGEYRHVGCDHAEPVGEATHDAPNADPWANPEYDDYLDAMFNDAPVIDEDMPKDNTRYVYDGKDYAGKPMHDQLRCPCKPCECYREAYKKAIPGYIEAQLTDPWAVANAS